MTPSARMPAQITPHQPVIRLVANLTYGLAIAAAASAPAQSVTVTSTQAGLTPRIIGVNSGHFMPGSNTTTWWKYASVNGGRIFTTPSRIEPSDDLGAWGDGVRTESQFLSRRAALRADPLDESYINWPYFEDNYATNDSGNINYQYAYSQLYNNGIEGLAMIGRTSGSFPFDPAGTSEGWKDRWEHWQHFYAQAFYLARHFDVERYSMYNEPDHSSQSVTQADYLERLAFASDAVQSAIADVNALYGKELNAQVLAPVLAGASGDYGPKPGGDPRDDVTGWGELVINNLHTNFLGEYDPDFQLVHTYAYQEYNHDGPRFAQELANTRQYVTADAPNDQVGYALTEFNVHTAGFFSTIPETLDSPSKFSRLGSIFANLVNEQPDELYLFKFSQTADGDSVKKNGIHYVSNVDAPYNIGSVTRGGAVLRLFARAFAGGQQLHDAPQSIIEDLHLASSYNPEQDFFYLLSANEAAQSRSLTVDLSAWGIEPGAVVQVDEVSEGRLAEVTHLLTAPANGTINLTQPAQSVLLFSAPRTQPDRHLILSATDDAMVKAGGNSGANYGSSDNLVVKNTVDTPGGRNVSFVKFDVSEVGDSLVERAVLQLQGENLGSDAYATAHVYAVANDNWSELQITWDSAPNLADAAGVLDSISDNFIEGINDTAEFVGHLTADQNLQLLSVDVTDFVRGHADDQVTFLIAREVRFDGEDVGDQLSYLRFASKERAGDLGPKLWLDLRDLALPGDYDNDGVVGLEDYELWRSSYGSSTDLRADGNQDGVVNLADYTVWRSNLGAAGALEGSITGTNASDASSAAVPSPSGFTIAVTALVCQVLATRLAFIR